MTAIQKITEEMGVHKQWYEDARGQTLATLPEFMRHILNDYEHDYGTICHALSACALGATWAADHSDQGGITGFQASFVMWGFVKHWLSKEGPLQLLDWHDALFPQYEEKFTTISADTLEALQKEAKERLAKDRVGVSPKVLKHWRSIAAGNAPFGMKVRE